MARSSALAHHARVGRPKVDPRAKAATFSISLSPTLAERTRQIAVREHRKNSSVVAAALDLYTAIPHDVRHVLDALHGSLRPEERERINRVIKSIAAERELEALSAEAVANLRSEGREVEAVSEAELVARANEAIRAVRAERRTGGAANRRHRG